MKQTEETSYEAISYSIFFFNVFIALMIIGFGTYMISKGGAGKYSVYFGFIMMAISVALKIVKKW